MIRVQLTGSAFDTRALLACCPTPTHQPHPMGRIVGGPYSTNKNLTALSTENLIDTFSYTPGVHGPYSQASKALPDRWKQKQLGTETAKGAATSCGYGGTVMGNALFVSLHPRAASGDTAEQTPRRARRQPCAPPFFCRSTADDVAVETRAATGGSRRLQADV
jgi:hypothetical protein